MIQEILLFTIGVIGLWFGAGITIDGARKVARHYKISQLFIGLTILSIGTSLPEIFTHVASSIKILSGIDASGVAVGTNIGSDIIQITLIMGILALFATVKSTKDMLKRDGMVMIGAIVLLWIFGLNGYLSQLEGMILIILYITYLVLLTRKEKNVRELISPYHKALERKKKNHVLKHISHIIIGIVMLAFASHWVVENTLFFAKTFGIEQTFFGLIVIGISTALPELTTAIRGIMKGVKTMSLGVLIGSNITNPMLAIGIGATISGYKISQTILWFDIPFKFVMSVLVIALFWKKNKLTKWQAGLLITSYFVYVAYKIYGIL
jgi:cation:H+ antiporter